MRHRYAILVVVLAVSLAGCSGGLSSGTDTPATDGPTTETDGQRTVTDGPTNATNDSSTESTATLQRLEMELRTTAMGRTTSVVNGTAAPGAGQVRLDRTEGDNRTTHVVSMPENWSSRLVENYDDQRRDEPGNVTVTTDYAQWLTLTLVFPDTTVTIRMNTVGGVPDRIPVTVGGRTYYSEDPELRAVVDELYGSLSRVRYDEPSTDR